jgi:hypothetical protein
MSISSTMEYMLTKTWPCVRPAKSGRKQGRVKSPHIACMRRLSCQFLQTLDAETIGAPLDRPKDSV